MNLVNPDNYPTLICRFCNEECEIFFHFYTNCPFFLNDRAAVRMTYESEDVRNLIFMTNIADTISTVRDTNFNYTSFSICSTMDGSEETI